MNPVSSVEYPRLSDAQLVERIVSGDAAAIAWLLCDQCGARLKYLAAVRYRAAGWEFEELVSEVFLQLSRRDWHALRLFQGENRAGQACRLASYVTLIASRLLAKRIIRQPSEMRAPRPPDQEEVDRLIDALPERHRQASEIRQAIMQLENLQHRDILFLYKVEERSVAEVAELLGISPANAYTRCSRAIADLRSLLEKEGVHA
ncbi:sigma-70 family RNA polymerase sigma factor [Opitutus sp. ER46]|uniref:RNA polymerase sigma factor n=1 Tax=Opitutus sp. ER46 TaxID=2161864 RepID=UPI000D326DFB|nr:sigma-70 family RNA polymerase sigma factor [Opitutus sp. ER46]PTX91200.1 hypothetical protein DB354_21450 [Opitutus sp. ER46]